MFSKFNVDPALITRHLRHGSKTLGLLKVSGYGFVLEGGENTQGKSEAAPTPDLPLKCIISQSPPARPTAVQLGQLLSMQDFTFVCWTSHTDSTVSGKS